VPQAAELFAAFDRRVRGLDATRRRIDALATDGELSRRAAEQVYESLFLSCFTSFEVFLEDVFLALLLTGGGTKAIPRLDVNSLTVARELVVGPGPKKYVDWFPYERTIERADIFFRGGRPFTNVQAPQRDILNKAQTIRNAIAHRSRHSQRRFEAHVIGNTNLAPREYRPAAYLRGVATAAPPQTRYEMYATQLLAVAYALTHATGSHRAGSRPLSRQTEI